MTVKHNFQIASYKSADFQSVKSFVESIQEHERIHVPELKRGTEIGTDYTQKLIDTIATQRGELLLATTNGKTIGFICAWIDEDDDMLLGEDAREHAYVSDIFVSEDYRGKGVAQLLLQTIETEMQKHGCKRIRICTKASNLSALKCYEKNGYMAYEIILSKLLTLSVTK